MLLKTILVFVLAYLVGSVTMGDIVARFKKVDLRGKGSGNIGATNVFRVLGPVCGAIVLLGDTLKGVVAVLLANWLLPENQDLSILAGVMAIVGHNWPLHAGFKGGKGIATSLGVIIALTPYSLLVAIPVWGLIFVAFGFVSLASILAAISYPISVFFFYHNDSFKIIFALIVAILAIYRHHVNIHRLIRGEEHRILYKNREGVKK
jgi:acyl phosphate:glycerol-3-phosphate acyltransferase